MQGNCVCRLKQFQWKKILDFDVYLNKWVYFTTKYCLAKLYFPLFENPSKTIS